MPASLKCALALRPAASRDWATSFRSSRRSLAEAEVEAGETRVCARHYRHASSPIASARGQRWFDAESHRIRGDILLKRDPANTAPAEEAFLTAIAIAQQQKARSFELRAAMSMARLWRDQSKRDAARELLAPVYSWFTEGFDTLDLKEAKALLDALRPDNEFRNGLSEPRSGLSVWDYRGLDLVIWNGSSSNLRTSAAGC